MANTDRGQARKKGDKDYYLDRVADFAEAVGLEMIAIPDDLDNEFTRLDEAAKGKRRAED